MTETVSLSKQLPTLLEQIRSAATLDVLEKLELTIVGRKQGLLTAAMQELRNLSQEERVKRGQELNEVKATLVAALDERRAELQSTKLRSLKDDDALDGSIPLPLRERGHLHLIPEFIKQVEEVFGRMGFEVAEGPEIDSEENNFDLLNFPKEHAARDSQDIFYLEKDKHETEALLLRGHTSTVQIRHLKTHKPPFRIICPGKVYRKDADATHSPMFHQFEGMMIGKDISLANMQAVMIAAVRALTFPDAEFRFRTAYFPFVEPGLEVDMRWRGDESQSREGRWLEIAGCGMTHPTVLKNCGIDPTKWQGFAFGFGVERMIMIKHQIPSIRLFYEGDLRFLRQF